MYAQYTGVINSNRPGFSESPYSVGTGVYQLETSLFFRKSQIYPTFSRPRSNGVDFLFRTSFFKERLEINANFAFQKEEVAFENIFTSSYFKTGISKFIVAGKYLIYEQEYKDKSKEIRSWKERHRFDWKRLIPSVAAYAGINTGIPDDIYKANSFSPKVGVLLQNDLTNHLNVVTNLYYDRIGTDLPEFSYIITATYSFNDRWSTFIENQTTSDKFEYTTSLGSGIAFLYNKNIQINSSLRLLADANATGFYASVGASYRFDRHVDEVTEVDENGNPIEEEEEEAEDGGKKKGFFGRLFSKITGVFKKKGSKAPTKLKDRTIESIKKNTNKDEITINNDSLPKVEKPIRTRPKRVRKKSTRVKPVKKKGGGFFGLFKGKKKKEGDPEDEKSINRELKKLEKEQKKLEKQQKKEEARKKKEEAKKKKKEERDKKKKDKKKKEDEKEDDS